MSLTERRGRRVRSGIVLCGGRGTRFSNVSGEGLKPLALIQERPLLWYVLGALYVQGVRHFVLPLGFKGERVRRYVERELDLPGVRVDCIDTGLDTPIEIRLQQVIGRLAGSDGLWLVNGDTLFEPVLETAVNVFHERALDGLLVTVPVRNPFGVVIQGSDGRARDFVRHSRVTRMEVEHAGEDSFASVYGGIALLRTKPLARWLANEARKQAFEAGCFGAMLREGRGAVHPHAGFWHCIDTSKDLRCTFEPLVAQSISSLARRIEAAIVEGRRFQAEVVAPGFGAFA